ncbi:hypothetical protein ACQKMD_01215 [Viridibacillus sp. NPDC096237]|uniref:hypothetical protein n=1 Tax=Viridibacillus sp. NPDC096237 TaxID=3390721 RepID=UPI003D050988
MVQMFEFQDMLADFETDIQVVVKVPGTNGGYNEETGEVIKPTPDKTVPLDVRGVLLPYTANEIYQSGGRLTQTHRQLIINMHVAPKTEVIHKGQKYSVENRTGYEDFADFIQYELKWVSAFG